MSGFFITQLRLALSSDPDLYYPCGRRLFIRYALRWYREAMCRKSVGIPDLTMPVTVLLQSYKRPWNMRPLVRLFLRFPCVQRVIVSNNNPDVHLQLRIRDSRLHVINQQERYPASLFGLLAFRGAQRGASCFLHVDDDLFLYPRQIAVLLWALYDDPSVPHGVVGQTCDAEGRPIGQHVMGDGTVDVINRAYAFTADHMRRYMTLLDQSGYRTDAEKAALPFGSDIVLSHSGNGKPHIHDVGPLLSCPTMTKEGIARFRERDFGRFRQDLYVKVQRMPFRAAMEDRS